MFADMWSLHLCGARRESGLQVGWRSCLEQHNFLVAPVAQWWPAMRTIDPLLPFTTDRYRAVKITRER